ncbi:DUF5691 domain-containing protein [Hymenobacter sp. BT730]|uniref:DUF5691 domain-containing protein n=1 Tax=Hymenobacter sp. BT730 TaxID=3063332 RepID=UPI0026E00089|nr:DUF5691 domain-containing protein [Hymenobacter sp. BT730]
MLAGTYSSFLYSYYQDLALSGRRVPHRLLAAALEQQIQHPPAYPNPYLLAALGERGAWLARLQPAWRSLVTLPEERTWTHGSPQQRWRFLLVCREQDPARGRALLAASLPFDPPWLQADFLSALSWQLTADDTPLLRPWLHSPDRGVRQAAQGLLQQRPNKEVVTPAPWQQGLQLLEDTLRQAAEKGYGHVERTIRQLVHHLVEQVPEAHEEELEQRLQGVVDACVGPQEFIGKELNVLRFKRQLRLSLLEPPSQQD